MPDGASPSGHSQLLSQLRAVAGETCVITGAAGEPFYTDVYRRLETPLAVVRPRSVEILQAVVRSAAAAGVAIFPRGGGASYSDGYLPTRPDSILIDIGHLDRIVAINEEDAIVTVEAGVTWAKLKAALDPLDLRTPFFGPFSGLAATVGGSMSQNALSHGSGVHGVSAQSALSFDVVTAAGELIRTGSAATGSAPFSRFYGPDLTGLFTGDCGALGLKARVTLPLLRRKPAWRAASFAFDTLTDMAGAMRRAAMEQLDDEHFAIDAALSQGQIARTSDAGALLGLAKTVLSSAPSLVSGVVRLGRMALAGAKAIGDAKFTLHVIFEGVSDAETKAKLGRYRQLAAPGREIANTVPTLVRGGPFAPLLNTLGPKGERWVPLHGLLAHSKVSAFHAALEALYASRAQTMQRLGIWRGGMFEAAGPSTFLYEVALYWPGPPTAYHHAALPATYLAGLPIYGESSETVAFVGQLKGEITALFAQFQATHFQLGKTYPYASALEPEALSLIRALKAAVDPKGLMNPGALGL